MRRLARSPALWALAAAVALATFAAPARADDELGLDKLRAGRAALQAGRVKDALQSLQEARTERPDDPLVAQLLGDALAADGQLDAAIDEYVRGEVAPYRRHSDFNRATTLDRRGEQALSAAQVPAAVEALPEGPQPEMLKAIGQATPDLEEAAKAFLAALDEPGDADSTRSARESIAALNRRVDALHRMQEELKKREQDQPKQDDKDNKDDKNDKDQKDQKQDSDKQDSDKQDQDKQDQDPQQDDSNDGARDKDDSQQPSAKDSQQEQQPPDGKKPEPQPQDKDADQQAKPQDGTGDRSEPARELSPEEVKQLLDRLAQLEDAARQREKAREAARRRPVEKDW